MGVFDHEESYFDDILLDFTSQRCRTTAQGYRKTQFGYHLYLHLGFDKNIDWVDFSQAQALALKEHKPIFLLITHSWCHACQSMKFDLKNDTRKPIFLELTKNFVMVNLEDKEEPEDKKYAPDGVYTPRLFFMGKLKKTLKNS